MWFPWAAGGQPTPPWASPASGSFCSCFASALRVENFLCSLCTDPVVKGQNSDLQYTSLPRSYSSQVGIGINQG